MFCAFDCSDVIVDRTSTKPTEMGENQLILNCDVGNMLLLTPINIYGFPKTERTNPILKQSFTMGKL